MDFGNNHSDGYTPKSHKYEPKWEKTVDYNPDHRPSDSAMFIEDRGSDVVWVLQVRGLGVIIMRAPDGAYTHPFTGEGCGISVFDAAEIGFCERGI